MRCVSGLMRMIWTLTVSPTARISEGVVDAAPGHIGDVQEAVDAAQIDERAVIGDVLDETVDDLAFGEAGDDICALFGACFFENGAAGHDDVAAPAVHLEDLEGLVLTHQRTDVADGADIDLRAGKERHGAVEVDGEAALDLVEDDACHLLTSFELLFETVPAFLAARLVAAEDGFAKSVFDALKIDFDFVTDLQLGLTRRRELAQRDAAFHFEADVDDGEILFDADDLAFYDAAFVDVVLGEAFGQKSCEIVVRRIHRVDAILLCHSDTFS